MGSLLFVSSVSALIPSQAHTVTQGTFLSPCVSQAFWHCLLRRGFQSPGPHGPRSRIPDEWMPSISWAEKSLISNYIPVAPEVLSIPFTDLSPDASQAPLKPCPNILFLSAPNSALLTIV